jgi:elongation factor P
LDSPFIKRRRKCNGQYNNTETDLPLSVDMPASVILEVTYAEPGIKGNTATNATKSATVETEQL